MCRVQLVVRLLQFRELLAEDVARLDLVASFEPASALLFFSRGRTCLLTALLVALRHFIC